MEESSMVLPRETRGAASLTEFSLVVTPPVRPKMLRHGMLSRLLDCRWIVGCLTLCATVLVPGQVMAQTPERVTAIPSNQLTDATPAQTSAINRLRQRKTTLDLSLVTVNIDALRGNDMRVSVPSMPTLTLSKRKEDVSSPTDFIWYGTLSDVPGQATLVVHDGNITGSIQDQNSLYRIEPIGNGVHALIKVDTGHFPPEHPPSFQQRERRGDIRPPTSTRDATGDATVGIDVMVPYTTAAKNAVADITATIQLAVAEANQSYVNSGIHIKLTLVDSFEVSSSESGQTFDTILADFVANPNVQAHRTSSGADLSAMIINQSDFCGLADAIMATASTAFAIVHYDCATGYYSFAHELGHLMGARHDENHDSTTSPYAYGHGYEHPSSAPGQSFRTVMAYACTPPLSCDPRVQYWSSPNAKYNNIATGTSDTNDNVRVLNATAGTVDAFNSPPPRWLRSVPGTGSDVPVASGTGHKSWYATAKTVHNVAEGGTDQRIRELFYFVGHNGQWFHSVPGTASDVPVANGTSPTSWYTTPENVQHIGYVGTDQRIHELFYFVGPNEHGSPTCPGRAKDLAVAHAFNPTSWYTTPENVQHIGYVGTVQRIDEMFYFVGPNGQWLHGVPGTASDVPVANGTNPTSWYTTPENVEHIGYVGTDQRIHELFFFVGPNGRWFHGVPGTGGVAPSTSPTSWYTTPET